jgi:hypothetical protein
LLLAVDGRIEDSRLGERGAGIPLPSFGICRICEIGLSCKFEGGIVSDMGDLAFWSGGVGRDFGAKVFGVSRTAADRGEPSAGEKGGVGFEPSIDI